MKKVLLVFCILPIYIFAIDMQKSYTNGIAAYKSQDFKTAYTSLFDVYLSNLSDTQFNFALGRSAYETGNYETALAAFERVEMLDPASIRNKLELAKTYFMLKMYQDSELAFQEVLENTNLPENIRTTIELYAKVQKVQQKSFTYASVNLDWIYDSNVNYGALDDTYTLFDTNGNEREYANASEESDYALQMFANIINVYDIGQKNGFAIKNKLTLFSKEYQDLDEYDIQYLGYTPSLLYKDTKNLREIGLDFGILNVADKAYLRTVAIVPKIEYRHTNTLKSIASIKLQKKDFVQKTHQDLDAKHYEIGYSLQKVLSPYAYIQGNLTALREKKEQGSRVDVNYKEYKAGIAYANQLTPIFSTDLLAEYKKRDYEDYSTLFQSKRSNDTQTVAVALKAKIMKTLTTHLKGTYNKVDSNQERFSYKKHTITLGLTKTF